MRGALQVYDDAHDESDYVYALTPIAGAAYSPAEYGPAPASYGTAPYPDAYTPDAGVDYDYRANTVEVGTPAELETSIRQGRYHILVIAHLDLTAVPPRHTTICRGCESTLPEIRLTQSIRVRSDACRDLCERNAMQSLSHVPTEE